MQGRGKKRKAKIRRTSKLRHTSVNTLLQAMCCGITCATSVKNEKHVVVVVVAVV